MRWGPAWSARPVSVPPLRRYSVAVMSCQVVAPQTGHLMDLERNGENGTAVLVQMTENFRDRSRKWTNLEIGTRKYI